MNNVSPLTRSSEPRALPLNGKALVSILKSEIRCATGCTEVGAAALVAAQAVEALGAVPEGLHLVVSPNVYKNGVHVAVPGTPFRGLAAAAAMGAIIADTSAGLAILGAVTPQVIERSRMLLDGGRITVMFDGASEDAVYLRAEAHTADGQAIAVIQGCHDCVIEVRRNGKVLFQKDAQDDHADPAVMLRAAPLASLLSLVDSIPLEDLEFLIEAAEVNVAAAEADLMAESALGVALGASAMGSPRGTAQALAGAASEARMAGRQVPVMAICGSGNHGIANFLGVLGFARAAAAPRERLARALAIASIVTVAVKAHTGKLTAFCGCAIAPATGLAAAAVYLMGGDSRTQEHAMQTVIGTFAGMLCDGAKESCAFKVAAAVGAAVDIAKLAMAGAYVPDSSGIVGRSIDETFANLGRINNPGMRETERVVLQLIAERTE